MFSSSKTTFTFLLVTGVLSACSNTYNPLKEYDEVKLATQQTMPEAAASQYDPELVDRGKYLTGLLGCGSCHTNGALIGVPDNTQLLAGSDVGIAYSNPMAESNPGIVYAGNLTPDVETGIGNWEISQIISMLQQGINNHNQQSIPVMPWPSYAKIRQDDAEAIAVYLKSLPPVKHQVPENVLPGNRARAPYVHFGVYQSR